MVDPEYIMMFRNIESTMTIRWSRHDGRRLNNGRQAPRYRKWLFADVRFLGSPEFISTVEVHTLASEEKRN